MGYEAANDSYINQKSGVLVNNLGIESEADLLKAEAEITSVESSAILFESDYTKIIINSQLLCEIHHQLFYRIYDWAGLYRTIDLQKGKTYFAHSAYIATQLEELLKDLSNENYLIGVGREEFVIRFAHYYSELNVIHPFREGNGRAIRLFLTLLAYRAGWSVAWERMNMQENIDACEAAYIDSEDTMIAMIDLMVETL